MPTLQEVNSGHQLEAKTGKLTQCKVNQKWYDRAINAQVQPSVHLYNALLAACDRFNKYDRAILLLEEMKRLEIHGNTVTHNLTVSICTEGVRTVESQQAAITAISAAVAAAGSIMIRAGVF